jgi:hypothetical protein
MPILSASGALYPQKTEENRNFSAFFPLHPLRHPVSFDWEQFRTVMFFGSRTVELDGRTLLRRSQWPQTK